MGAQEKAIPEAVSRLGPKELSRALRDVGIGSDGAGLERLDYTLKEADRIIASAPAGTGMEAVSFRANRALAMSPELGQYRVIHFATHAILDDKQPELSGIVLSLVNEQGQPQNGYLRLSDIYNLKLPVELVVLSACRTGIGQEVRGEGLIGLTRGFMYAGAARVLATLWKVRDDATAELMSHFYWHLLKERTPAASALRKAQLELMQMSDEWSKPFFWAGFVLQGDWK
jgi:CHAT domain-containing protein